MAKNDKFELIDLDDKQVFEADDVDFEYTLKTMHCTETATETKKRRTTLRVRVRSRVQNDEKAAENNLTADEYAALRSLLADAYRQGFADGVKHAGDHQTPVRRISFDDFQ